MLKVTPEQVDLWRALPSETQILEFKEAKRNFDSQELHRYCVAIANEGGGHLVFGVADKAPRQVVGTTAFLNPIRTAEQIFTAIGFRVDVCEVAHPDGTVVVMQIPSRPRGTAYSLRGQYWMRSGEQLVPMSEDMLRTIFKEGEPDWLEQPTKSGLSKTDVLELLDIEACFALREMPVPSREEDIFNRLVQEGFIDRDKGFSIRRRAALLLANQLSDFSDLSRKAARVVVYRGSSKIETAIDMPIDRGYAVGFEALVSFIVERLPQNEVIEDALRTTKLIPKISIRELAANALIHQDFSISGTSSMFEIYEDRMEFTNPGVPLFSVDRFIDSHQSRNERLAESTRRLRICEEKGSGIDRVIQMAELYQLPAPEFRVGHNSTIVTIFGQKSFEEMDRQDRVRACYQHCALKYVTNSRMTNQSLRERFKLPEAKSSTISQIISQAVEAGRIKPDEKRHPRSLQNTFPTGAELIKLETLKHGIERLKCLKINNFFI